MVLNFRSTLGNSGKLLRFSQPVYHCAHRSIVLISNPLDPEIFCLGTFIQRPSQQYSEERAEEPAKLWPAADSDSILLTVNSYSGEYQRSQCTGKVLDLSQLPEKKCGFPAPLDLFLNQ